MRRMSGPMEDSYREVGDLFLSKFHSDHSMRLQLDILRRHPILQHSSGKSNPCRSCPRLTVDGKNLVHTREIDTY